MKSVVVVVVRRGKARHATLLSFGGGGVSLFRHRRSPNVDGRGQSVVRHRYTTRQDNEASRTLRSPLTAAN